MVMKKILVALLAVGSILSFGTVAMAKVDWKAAPKQKQRQSNPVFVGAALTNGGDSDFGVGARIEYPLDALMPNLSITGSFNYFFPSSDDTWWEFNANALYSFPVNEMFTPYVGAGINYASWKYTTTIYYDIWDDYYFSRGREYRRSYSDSATSLNVIGGCKLNLNAGFTPFIEARMGVGDNEQFEITAGVLFGF